MSTPLEILKQINTISSRVEAIAEDFNSGADKFSNIDTYKLAELLGLQPEEFENRESVGYRISLDLYSDPIYNFIYPLEGKVSAERIREIDERSKAFEKGEAESDAQLTPAEKNIIEDVMSEENLEDGAGWILAGKTIISETGIELDFLAEIDHGECFGCYGPYQIRDEQGPDL